MGKSVHVAAVACTTTACVVFIVAVVSSAWLIGCLSYDNIFKAVEHQPEMQELTLRNNYQEIMKMFSGMKMCVHIGLFRVTMKTFLDVSFGVDVSDMPTAILLGIASVILSIILGAVAAIFLLVAAVGDVESYEGKGAVAKRTRVAIILLVLAGCAGIVGMSAYTRGTFQASEDPLMFLAQVGSSAASTFKNLMLKSSSDVRGKRDLSLSGISPDMKQYISTLIGGMEPFYGYAYVLGWIAVALLICSAILATVAKQRLLYQPFNYSAVTKT